MRRLDDRAHLFLLEPGASSRFSSVSLLETLYTRSAHFGVGVADALAPLGGWMAVQKSFSNMGPALWLGAFTFFWVSGFDVIYATMDEAFDRSQGLRSLPSHYGKEKALRISGILHALAFGCLIVLYIQTLHSSFVTLLTLCVIGGLLFLEHRLV